MQLKEVSKDTATCNAVLQLQWKKGIRWVHSHVLLLARDVAPMRKGERYNIDNEFIFDWTWYSHLRTIFGLLSK